LAACFLWKTGILDKKSVRYYTKKYIDAKFKKSLQISPVFLSIVKVFEFKIKTNHLKEDLQ